MMEVSLVWKGPSVHGFASILLSVLAAPGLLGTAALDQGSSRGGNLDYYRVASATDGRCTAIVKREGLLYSIEVYGLEPDESFPMSTSSAGEEIRYTASANREGYYVMILAPNVKNRSNGIAHVAFQSARCNIHVSFPWRDN
jgi:hypothetical protein